MSAFLDYDGNNPLTWCLLTPAERYERDDIEHCPRCGWAMEWQDFNNSEAGYFWDGNCTNPDCGFTDGA